MTSLRLAIQSIYEQLDYQAAGDQDVDILCDIDGARAAALYRGLVDDPERCTNIVLRTVSWALLSPGATVADVAHLQAVASALVQWRGDLHPRRATEARSTGSVSSLASNAQRALMEGHPAAFAALLDDFRRTHLRQRSGRLLASAWLSWMDNVVMAPHGTPAAVLVARFDELCRSEAVARGFGGETTYEPLLPAGPSGFGEVWRNGPDNSLERCVLDACEVSDEGREMRLSLRVDRPLANPLAVEYLFEQGLLWRAFAGRYRDRLRVIHYDMEGRTWSHVVA
jgi:hypothetical protein